ncbi:MAG: hypothetical protein NT107_15140 [Planctomycetota bacterium]|nr:hypothetical protein [Planctomycetota bacterium]
MQKQIFTFAVLAALSASLAAQSNTVPGLNGNLYDIGSPTCWGRTGAAFPGGLVGFSSSNTMCNNGSIAIPWFATMSENHPKFGFIIARLLSDRFEQVSDRSFCKHAFLSLNTASGPCLPCSNPTSGSQMFVGCGDVYSAGNNASQTYLGPADEINPFLGTWNHTGSYFDRGDPEVGAPNNTDGIRSLSTTGFGAVKNRVTLKESNLALPGASYWSQIHLIHEGESQVNRSDNLMSRGVTYTRSVTTGAWSSANNGAVLAGTILNRWTGSTVTMAGNGNDDGRFAVAVKVTGPTNGLWHYEYVVHNVDNYRGAAAFRIPTCSSARVFNLGFRDIDDNALNQWTTSVGTSEIAFLAPSTNPQNWNTLFNYWFDSDASPVTGNVTFDEARIGLGALSVVVPSTIPGSVPNVYLGAGCGTSNVRLSANGIATIPAPSFALKIATTPVTGVVTLFSFGTANIPLALGCSQFLDATTMGTFAFVLTDALGNATLPLPIPPGIDAMQINFQSGSLVTAGAVLGGVDVSNGLGVRIGMTGCP